MAELGIYDYGARFYSPKLGRFLSADTIVPNAHNPQDLNRFSYVRNNPIRYNDPTGHCADPLTGTMCLGVAITLPGLTVMVAGVAAVAILTYVIVTPRDVQRENAQRAVNAIKNEIEATSAFFAKEKDDEGFIEAASAFSAKKKDDVGFIEELLRKHGLLKDRKNGVRRGLHDDEISGYGLTEEEIEAEIADKAADIARRLKNKDKNKDKKSRPE